MFGGLVFSLVPALAQKNRPEANTRENARTVVQDVIQAAIKRLFKSDRALAVLLEFADHSRIREEAVAFTCVYPVEKIQPILEKFVLSDPNSEVRKAAKRCLGSYKNAG